MTLQKVVSAISLRRHRGLRPLRLLRDMVRAPSGPAFSSNPCRECPESHATGMLLAFRSDYRFRHAVGSHQEAASRPTKCFGYKHRCRIRSGLDRVLLRPRYGAGKCKMRRHSVPSPMKPQAEIVAHARCRGALTAMPVSVPSLPTVCSSPRGLYEAVGRSSTYTCGIVCKGPKSIRLGLSQSVRRAPATLPDVTSGVRACHSCIGWSLGCTCLQCSCLWLHLLPRR